MHENYTKKKKTPKELKLQSVKKKNNNEIMK